MSNVVSGGDTQNGVVSGLLRMIKFTVVSYLISLILIAGLSAIVCYTDVPESVSTPGVRVITFIGVFLSAFMCAARANGKGWLVGGVAGVVNILLLQLIGLAFEGGAGFTTAGLMQMLCGFVVGATGGIFGINLSEK